jgi:hypothetical protein
MAMDIAHLQNIFKALIQFVDFLAMIDFLAMYATFTQFQIEFSSTCVSTLSFWRPVENRLKASAGLGDGMIYHYTLVAE